jgi:hypothetical protein
MGLVGLGVGADDVGGTAGGAVGSGGTGVGAAPRRGCAGSGTKPGPISGMGLGGAPAAGSSGTGGGSCATLNGGDGPPEPGTGCLALPAMAVDGGAAGTATATFVAGLTPTRATGFPTSSKVTSSPAWRDLTTKR